MTPHHRWFPTAALVSAALVSALVPARSAAQNPPPTCEDTPGYHELDFWVGSWDVLVGGQLAGTNRIEKILNGCAVAEYWTANGGGDGLSLFYFLPLENEWRQVWVTTGATATGGTKEKRLVERLDGGAVRFQGEIGLPSGGTYLDRTTLTPLDGGRVRQLIEISTDGGETWRATFDGLYVPREGGA